MRRRSFLGRLLAAPQWTVPAGAFASIAVAVLAVALLTSGPARESAPTPLDDLEIFTTQADLDLLENLEFYEWIVQSESTG